MQNNLLQKLPTRTLARLTPSLEEVDLRRGQILEEPRLSVTHAYFIDAGIVSIQARTSSDGLLGAGIIGSGGMTGLPIVLRTGRSPLRAVVQSAGRARRIAADRLVDLLDEDPALQRALFGYVQAVLVQSSYLALCNARHSVDQRVRRWLLLARIAVGADDICVTHNTIAGLLGVRRPSVTDTLSELQRAGGIEQQRGCIVVRDRDLLAHGACDCHRIIAAEFARVGTLAPARADGLAAARTGSVDLEQGTRRA